MLAPKLLETLELLQRTSIYLRVPGAFPELHKGLAPYTFRGRCLLSIRTASTQTMSILRLK
jgi:hypothetical protein